MFWILRVLSPAQLLFRPLECFDPVSSLLSVTNSFASDKGPADIPRSDDNPEVEKVLKDPQGADRRGSESGGAERSMHFRRLTNAQLTLEGEAPVEAENQANSTDEKSVCLEKQRLLVCDSDIPSNMCASTICVVSGAFMASLSAGPR
jgi:hypothetical protein